MEIKNRTELIHNLADLIAENESLLLPYQVDIYAYYDNETGIVELSEFTNVGGNSWLNDDHYTIYVVKQSCNTVSDYYENASDMAEAIGKDINTLRAETAEDLDCDLEYVEDSDIKHYIMQHYEEEITRAFREWYMSEYEGQFLERAMEAVSEYENEIN